MFAEFVRFYQGYTLKAVFEMYAKTFFALVNAMHKIEASEALTAIRVSNADQKTVDDFIRQAKGLDNILEQVKVIKK